jgi:hypothetical protein
MTTNPGISQAAAPAIQPLTYDIVPPGEKDPTDPKRFIKPALIILGTIGTGVLAAKYGGKLPKIQLPKMAKSVPHSASTGIPTTVTTTAKTVLPKAPNTVNTAAKPLPKMTSEELAQRTKYAKSGATNPPVKSSGDDTQLLELTEDEWSKFGDLLSKTKTSSSKPRAPKGGNTQLFENTPKPRTLKGGDTRLFGETEDVNKLITPPKASKANPTSVDPWGEIEGVTTSLKSAKSVTPPAPQKMLPPGAEIKNTLNSGRKRLTIKDPAKTVKAGTEAGGITVAPKSTPAVTTDPAVELARSKTYQTRAQKNLNPLNRLKEDATIARNANKSPEAVADLLEAQGRTMPVAEVERRLQALPNYFKPHLKDITPKTKVISSKTNAALPQGAVKTTSQATKTATTVLPETEQMAAYKANGKWANLTNRVKQDPIITEGRFAKHSPDVVAQKLQDAGVPLPLSVIMQRMGLKSA